jgi:hypothetical protein
MRKGENPTKKVCVCVGGGGSVSSLGGFGGTPRKVLKYEACQSPENAIKFTSCGLILTNSFKNRKAQQVSV